MNINKTLNIAIACFVGAFIGALLAIQFHHYWLFGVLIGGIVGYVTYNFREIPTTAKMVWAKMPERQNMKKFIADCELKEKMKEAISTILLGFVFITFFISVIAGVITAIFSYINTVAIYVELYQGSSFHINQINLSRGEIIFGSTATIILLCFIIRIQLDDKKDITTKYLLIAIFIGIPILTPFLLPVVAFVASGFGIYWLGKVGIKVGWATFKIVHSDIRLLCMVDAMIGATAGYWFGNTLIGGIIGAISGVINYELVSKRWLKLIPSQVKIDP